MTKEENTLFCRIAIHNRLVSLEDANTCLREALTTKKNVSEVLVAQGMLTKEQALKIRQAVIRQKGGAPAVRAASPASRSAARRRGETEEGAKRRPAPKQSSAQLAVTIVSLLVFAVVIVVLIVLLLNPSKQEEAANLAKSPTSPAGLPAPGSIGPKDLGPGPAKPMAPPVMSEAEKAEVQGELDNVIMDAKRSIDEKTGAGIAALDGFLANYGARATQEQKDRVKAERDNLLARIKERFAKDKQRLLEAKAKNDAAAVDDIAKDIENYADPETMKEVEQLKGGT